MAALVPEGVELCLGQRMMMFRLKESEDPRYHMWLLNSDAIYQQVLETVVGPTAPHVNISDIINFHIPAPPLKEQQQIGMMVDREINKLDVLIVETVRAESLLLERRAALISAAVTGKIDVRGLAPAEAEAA